MTGTVGTQRPAVEVADVMRQYGDAFLARYGGRLSVTQRKALRDLSRCRTAALGGHVQRCLDCGHQRIAYNSCRNRHCPKCQALARARWLEREANLLLPVAYYHVVFTLPQEVAELALANPRLLYEALFQAAAVTLREVAANCLGAAPSRALVAIPRKSRRPSHRARASNGRQHPLASMLRVRPARRGPQTTCKLRTDPAGARPTRLPTP